MNEATNRAVLSEIGETRCTGEQNRCVTINSLGQEEEDEKDE